MMHCENEAEFLHLKKKQEKNKFLRIFFVHFDIILLRLERENEVSLQKKKYLGKFVVVVDVDVVDVDVDVVDVDVDVDVVGFVVVGFVVVADFVVVVVVVDVGTRSNNADNDATHIVVVVVVVVDHFEGCWR